MASASISKKAAARKQIHLAYVRQTGRLCFGDSMASYMAEIFGYDCSPWGLRIENLSEDAGPGCRIGLSHNMLDMILDRLFGNLQCVSDFLVRPTLSQMLHDRLFAIGKVKLLL